MNAGFQHPAAGYGQPRKCALQSPECPHYGRNVGFVLVSEQDMGFVVRSHSGRPRAPVVRQSQYLPLRRGRVRRRWLSHCD
jgi:hypothetical protein